MASPLGKVNVEILVLMFIMIHVSGECCCVSNADNSCSYQLSSVHRVWYHTLSRKRVWDHFWSKSVFTCPQFTNSKACSKQNLTRSSPLNIRHSCCSCEGWFTKQPLHCNFIACSRKLHTWRAVVWTSCSWHSMVDWQLCQASSTFIWCSIF